MGVITIGLTVSNRDSAANFSNSTIIYRNAASATGKINTFNIWVNTDMPNLKIGVFSKSGSNFTCRSYTTIGTATAGSKSYTGLDLDVVAGDYIGTYWSTGGKIEADSGGGNYWFKSGDNFTNGSQSYTDNSGYSDDAFSINGTGTSADGPANLKSWNGLAKASIKSINGLAIGSVKSVNGLA
jgi:hypothetical protein